MLLIFLRVFNMKMAVYVLSVVLVKKNLPYSRIYNVQLRSLQRQGLIYMYWEDAFMQK